MKVERAGFRVLGIRRVEEKNVKVKKNCACREGVLIAFRFSWPAEVGAVGSWIFEKRKFFDGRVEMCWQHGCVSAGRIGRAQQKLEQF